jgi:quercetin dioxygenase-like cupin family protein
MVPEAELEETDAGLLPAANGWYVLNAREAPWLDRAGRAHDMVKQGKADFSQLGIGLTVLEPGQAMSMYHWEADQEDFLVLSGEALAIVEGQERPLRQWDFLHCPAGTSHVIVGAGDGPCIVFAVGARWLHTYRTPEGTLAGRDNGGAYAVDEAALRHGAGVEVETTDADVAYASWPKSEIVRYRDGWLPSP